MNKCQTKRLTQDRSTCLSGLPECPFKVTLGFNCICTHPDHEKFSITNTERSLRKGVSSYV